MNGHSKDFRQKVIADYRQTNNMTMTSKKFGISFTTLKRWVNPEYCKKCRAIHKYDYYNKIGYKEKHITTITKNRLKKMKDPEYRKKSNEYFRKWAYNKYHTDPAYKERQQKNANAYIKRRCKTDSAYRLKERLRAQLRNRLKSKNITERMDTLIGCTIPQLKEHIEKQFKPGMSWDNYNEWHVDHIKPCSLFDLTNPKDQKKCFHYTNLQPLWAKENLQKSSKYFHVA